MRGTSRGGVVGLVALAGLVGIVALAWRHTAPAAPASARRLGPGAAVVRDGARLAAIERRTAGRGRGRLPVYLAPARGPAIDSARVGVLAARLAPGTGSGAEPVIALVPRDAVAGLPLVGRLVVTPGEPGLMVYGAATPRR